MLQVLITVKLRYKPNKLLGTLFEWYKYYICTVFFHGIRFKVKDKNKQGCRDDSLACFYVFPWRLVCN